MNTKRAVKRLALLFIVALSVLFYASPAFAACAVLNNGMCLTMSEEHIDIAYAINPEVFPSTIPRIRSDSPLCYRAAEDASCCTGAGSDSVVNCSRKQYSTSVNIGGTSYRVMPENPSIFDFVDSFTTPDGPVGDLFDIDIAEVHDGEICKVTLIGTNLQYNCVAPSSMGGECCRLNKFQRCTYGGPDGCFGFSFDNAVVGQAIEKFFEQYIPRNIYDLDYQMDSDWWYCRTGNINLAGSCIGDGTDIGGCTDVDFDGLGEGEGCAAFERACYDGAPGCVDVKKFEVQEGEKCHNSDFNPTPHFGRGFSDFDLPDCADVCIDNDGDNACSPQSVRLEKGSGGYDQWYVDEMRKWFHSIKLRSGHESSTNAIAQDDPECPDKAADPDCCTDRCWDGSGDDVRSPDLNQHDSECRALAVNPDCCGGEFGCYLKRCGECFMPSGEAVLSYEPFIPEGSSHDWDHNFLVEDDSVVIDYLDEEIYVGAVDCNDDNANITPLFEEIDSCDHRDNDCDYVIDECKPYIPPMPEGWRGGSRFPVDRTRAISGTSTQLTAFATAGTEIEVPEYDEEYQGNKITGSQIRAGTFVSDQVFIAETGATRAIPTGGIVGEFLAETPLTVEELAELQRQWEEYAISQGLAREKGCVYSGAYKGCQILDADQDGYADERFDCSTCTDCDDTAEDADEDGIPDGFFVNPGIDESIQPYVSDGIDNNCNDLTDEFRDDDGDGVGDGFEPEECRSERDTFGRLLDYSLTVVDENGCTYSTMLGTLEGWVAGPGTPSAYVIADTTSPNPESFRVLKIEGSDGDFLEYLIDSEGSTQYTFTFRYRLDAGSHITFSVVSTETGEVLASEEVNENSWTRHSLTFETPEDAEGDGHQTKVVLDLHSSTFLLLDDLQFEKSPEPTAFNPFKHEFGCCPQDFCWTSYQEGLPACVHDDVYENNVLAPPLGTRSLDERGFDFESGFRCIDGDWKFSRVKYTPLFDEAGFCPEDDQCFIGTGGGLRTTAEEACVPNGEFRITNADDVSLKSESFYCYEGNWTTRTKAIALQLLDLTTESDTYTLFCDRFSFALNPLETALSWRGFNEDGAEKYFRASLPDDHPAANGNPVNEFCVLRLNDQIISGVSLNVEINESVETVADISDLGGEEVLSSEEKNFMELLKGDLDYCDSVMEDPANYDGLFHSCNPANDIYYNPTLKSAIFSKVKFDTQEVPGLEGADTGFLGGIVEGLRNILNRLLTAVGLARIPDSQGVPVAQLDFVKRAGSFDKLYMAYNPDGPADQSRDVMALRETRFSRPIPESPGQFKKFLSVEYRNYQSDICHYYYQHLPANPALRSSISDSEIRCNVVITGDESWLYNIFVEEPKLDNLIQDSPENFWNDITAKVRPQPVPAGSPVPSLGELVTEPDTPVVGTELNLSVEVSSDDRVIGLTWDFGDGTTHASPFFTQAGQTVTASVLHKFAKSGEFTVKVYAMNEFYEIASVEAVLNVRVAPQVSISTPGVITAGESFEIIATISSGNPPYNVYWDFDGDGEFDDEDIDIAATPPVELRKTHTYDSDGEYDLILNGADRDGIQFSKKKTVFADRGIIVL